MPFVHSLFLLFVEIKNYSWYISVHFEEKEGHTIAHVVDNEKGEEEEILGGKTTEESMNEIVDAQKRILDQWCFAEHYEPKVLLQVWFYTVFD